MSNEDTPSNTSRRLAMTSGAALLGTTIIGNMSANAQPAGTPASAPPAGAMPQRYNILFVLVDQEHFLSKWPFPAGARGHQEEVRYLPQSPGGLVRLLLGPVRRLHGPAHPATGIADKFEPRLTA
ncbi:MAG: hypothetical protein GEV13_05425 [Rhodospirillales bacterium]|nr:hypothetical protein [Rhodospirillales bacterium]